MSKAAQLKKRASEFEHKRQFDRALATYVQAIEAAAGIPDEIDIPLYNRVGDLHLRLGDINQAVSYYEMAVDLYAEGGFFNNAIALCNKVLRHAPARSSIYYKLGKISAKKGFNSDAKQNFLEYADRMQKGGQLDEAFRALKEFADLCPGHDDVRLMLAKQLARAGRKDEALEQLQTVHDTMVAEDRATEAAATLERMRTLDPAAEPRRTESRRPTKRDGLVFIDVNYQKPDTTESAGQGEESGQTSPQESEPEPPTAAPMLGLEPTSFAADPVALSRHGRPLTPLEFRAVELPPSSDVPVKKTLDESPLTGLTPLEDPLPPLLDATPVDADEPPMLVASIVDEPTMWIEPPPMPQIMSEPIGSDPVESDLEESESTEAELVESELEQSYESTEQQEPDRVLEAELSAVAPTEPEVVEQSFANSEPPTPTSRQDDDFVDLQAWLRDTEPAKNPRMKADFVEPQDQIQSESDFSEMLETFKRGVAQNVDESDSDSQYDLGVAFMEMGLFDEAISQFQKALRGDATAERRIRSYESLGQCFIEMRQYDIAIASLDAALDEAGAVDGKLVGVLYLLGYASESLHRWSDAAAYYKRVFAVDIHFRDTAERLPIAQRNAQHNPHSDAARNAGNTA